VSWVLGAEMSEEGEVGAGGGRIIVALDVPTAQEAARLARQLSGAVAGFKVGLELFHAEGPGVFAALRQAGAERIWYDGKFNDIPNTVARATRQLARHGLWMIDVHAMAGSAAVRAVRQAAEEGAADSRTPRPLVLAITILTSLDAAAVHGELGLPGSLAENVARLARMSREAGADGAVCSPLEAGAVRAACGPEFLIVTPGVRSAAAADDQRRLATPRAPVEAGADFLVIGREITGAPDPRSAAERLAREAAGIGT
jgi:orotidine-5'-phosphate decarboxylase